MRRNANIAVAQMETQKGRIASEDGVRASAKQATRHVSIESGRAWRTRRDRADGRAAWNCDSAPVEYSYVTVLPVYDDAKRLYRVCRDWSEQMRTIGGVQQVVNGGWRGLLQVDSDGEMPPFVAGSHTGRSIARTDAAAMNSSREFRPRLAELDDGNDGFVSRAPGPHHPFAVGRGCAWRCVPWERCCRKRSISGWRSGARITRPRRR